MRNIFLSRDSSPTKRLSEIQDRAEEIQDRAERLRKVIGKLDEAIEKAREPRGDQSSLNTLKKLRGIRQKDLEEIS